MLNRTEAGPVWQARGHDRDVRNAKEFAVKLDYISSHPVKRGLVTSAENLKWSSFRHYVFRDVGGGDRVGVDGERPRVTHDWWAAEDFLAASDVAVEILTDSKAGGIPG